MENFKNSCNNEKVFLFDLIRKRMQDKKIEHFDLAKTIQVNDSTLRRNLKNENEMSVTTLFKILSVLEIRPSFIPFDKNQESNNI